MSALFTLRVAVPGILDPPGSTAGRAAEPPRPEIVSSAGDGVAAAGEVGGDDLRAKLAANAGEDVAMQ